MENEKLVERLLHRGSIYRKMNATTALTLEDEAATALTAAEARIKMLSEALAFYSCDDANCDCVQGKEQSDRVACGFKARQSLTRASDAG